VTSRAADAIGTVRDRSDRRIASGKRTVARAGTTRGSFDVGALIRVHATYDDAAETAPPPG
jgi:hypothetical protein